MAESINNFQGNIIVNGSTEADNIYSYYADNVTIVAYGGNDTIKNDGGNGVLVYGGAGDDRITDSVGSNNMIYGEDGNDNITISSSSKYVTADGGNGNDNLYGYGDNLKLIGGEGTDYVYNLGDNSTILTGNDNDTVNNYGGFSYIALGDGNDSIRNETYYYNSATASSVTISAGNGNDYVYNSDNNLVSIDAGAGDDYVGNDGDRVTINAGDGNDQIKNGGDYVNISAGIGNDTIYANNYCERVTINGGDGNDFISLSSGASLNVVQYVEGSGNDTLDIQYGNYNYTNTLQIFSDNGYSTVQSGNNLVLNVGENSITLTWDTARALIDGNLTIETRPFLEAPYEVPNINTGSAALQDVSTDNAGNVVITTSEGTQTLRGAAGRTVKFKNDFIEGEPLNVQFSSNLNINEDDTFYWGTGADANVALANYTQPNAEIKLNNTNFNDTNNISFFGDIKTINATGYTGHAVLNGKDGKDNIIFGGEGTSVLWGGYNSDDVLVGGNGSDLFWYIQGSGNDWIRNSSSNDKILMEGITLDELVGGGGQIIGNDVVVELQNG